MNELKNTREFINVRLQLLATVSAAVLLAAAASNAQADDQARPTVWIELGGQLEKMSGQGERFNPAFIDANQGSPAFGSSTPVDAQRLPDSFGGSGAITFQPQNSDWSFNASVRYGRSVGKRRLSHQSKGFHHTNVRYYYPTGVRVTSGTAINMNFSQTDVDHNQGHTIADFQVGRDVGLGILGRNGSSRVDFGVRFAQFTSKSTVRMYAVPDEKQYNFFAQFPSAFPASYYFATQRFHNYSAFAQSTRSFHGIGPSISWAASAPIIGEPEKSEIDFDWGINAAVLFGRQRANGVHHTTSQYHRRGYPLNLISHSASFARERAKAVPNIGGFAGLSFRYDTAKVSFGYRADLFFGAMDAGMDTRNEQNVGFYGPFASISIGLGG